ncbi:hypothetical protein NOVOSPHI9U_50075 [Novosphingobium sp. 9U]|nr:hypothetical protein NOVOSPHI9U_50075 [Novosphingobium sp. 9U]
MQALVAKPSHNSSHAILWTQSFASGVHPLETALAVPQGRWIMLPPAATSALWSPSSISTWSTDRPTSSAPTTGCRR